MSGPCPIGSKYLDRQRVVISTYISILDILLCPYRSCLFDSCIESVTLIYLDSPDECRSGSDEILARFYLPWPLRDVIFMCGGSLAVTSQEMVLIPNDITHKLRYAKWDCGVRRT